MSPGEEAPWEEQGWDSSSAQDLLLYQAPHQPGESWQRLGVRRQCRQLHNRKGEEETDQNGTLEGAEEPPWKEWGQSPEITPETNMKKGNLRKNLGRDTPKPLTRIVGSGNHGQNAVVWTEDLWGEAKAGVDRAEGWSQKELCYRV